MQTRPFGFTLIELLVVLLIISLSFTFAVVSFGHFGKKREANMAAEKIQRVLLFLREQAILDARELRLDFTPFSYSSTASGSPLPSFTSATLPSGLKMYFHPANAHLVVNIHASGAMTPFRIDIGTTTQPSLSQLSGQANGTLHLSSS